MNRFTAATAILLLITLSACTPARDSPADRPEYRSWSTYLGDKGSTQYSSLNQITTENVPTLEVAWTFSSGDLIEGSQIQANPIVIDQILYSTTPQLKLFALDAGSGEQIWMFDPFEGQEPAGRGVNRGVEYWSDGAGDRRLFYVAGDRLYAINADTGEPVAGFGEGGSVDFKLGLGRDVSGLFVSATSPGVVYEDLLIQGSRVAELPNAAPGHIRAYDVRTGEIRWVFHTIPQPGEYGYDTWPPDAWTRTGGANSWPGMTLDDERGIVYIPTGSAAFDFYGGDRHGENLFANSLLALNAATGERIWHYQFVRHDLWDRDPPAAPALVAVQHEGRQVDAVAQTTKTGHIFLFNRETGEPLFPIEEVETPSSDLAGEEIWPSQPLPMLPEPFARQEFGEEDITNISPESHTAVLERFREIRSGHPWAPPSEEGTLIFPGFDGGAEWGGAAADPETGVLYVNSNEMPWILTMVEVETPDDATKHPGRRIFALNCAACHGADRAGDSQGIYPSLVDLEERLSENEIRNVIEDGQGIMPSFGYLTGDETDALIAWLTGTEMAEQDPGPLNIRDLLQIPYAHTGWHRFLDPEGYPAIKPPWGTLNAIDLNNGETLWQVPLGEFEELTERGIPQTGTENYGGPVVTAGGLLFIGATQDEKFRAFDKRTGELLWETDLPAGGYATPAVYEVDGRQFVVIAAGGGKMGTPSGDSYIAFSLPNGE